MADLQESYRTLGITPGATFDEAKLAWRNRAQALHPDRLQEASPEERAAAERQFKELSQAWRVVRVHLGGAEADQGPGGVGPATGGSWDQEWAATYGRPPTQGPSKRAITVVVIAAVCLVAFFGYRTWTGNQSEDYSPEVQSGFLNGCQNGGGTLANCRCLLDAMMQEVPADEIQQFFEQISTTGTLSPRLEEATFTCF